jgi:hypothetical protein
MFLALLVLAGLVSVQPTQGQAALLTVRILEDGTVSPGSAPIQRVGNQYVFNGNLFGLVVIEKSNIVLEGAGYTLQGNYNGTRPNGWMIGQGPPNASDNTSMWTIGVDFSAATKPTNVTVRNLNVRGFYVGMYVWTSGNSAEGNGVAGNILGFLLSGSSNNITENYVAENEEGIFLGVNGPGTIPLNITLSGNSLIDNKVQFSGCTCEEYNLTEAIHTWDNGSRGNFWSDYNGVDHNGDGIGDAPYVVDPKNQDRYPLAQIYATAPTPKEPSPTPTTNPNSFPENTVSLMILGVVTFMAILVAAVLIRHKRRKKRGSI